MRPDICLRVFPIISCISLSSQALCASSSKIPPKLWESVHLKMSCINDEGGKDEDASDVESHVEEPSFRRIEEAQSTTISKKDERKLSAEGRKEARRLRKEAAKEQKRGRSEQGRKPCERCKKPECELLIRAQCKEWAGWKLVCGKCWKDISGGVTDGDLEHRDYVYGGLWRFRKGYDE
jgi:hypothetical protein